MATPKVKNPFEDDYRQAEYCRDSNARICVQEVLDGNPELAPIWAEKSKAAGQRMRDAAIRADEWARQKKAEAEAHAEKAKNYRNGG